MSTIEPLRLSFEIECSRAHTFEVWTTRLSTWWPKGHSASGDPNTVAILERHLGGRIFERTSDGMEIDWGVITTWDPPSELGYEWHITRNPSEATDVLLEFVALGDSRTRLDIVQSGWERLGAQGAEFRNANSSGWNALIPSFVAAAIEEAR